MEELQELSLYHKQQIFIDIDAATTGIPIVSENAKARLAAYLKKFDFTGPIEKMKKKIRPIGIEVHLTDSYHKLLKLTVQTFRDGRNGIDEISRNLEKSKAFPDEERKDLMRTLNDRYALCFYHNVDEGGVCLANILESELNYFDTILKERFESDKDFLKRYEYHLENLKNIQNLTARFLEKWIDHYVATFPYEQYYMFEDSFDLNVQCHLPWHPLLKYMGLMHFLEKDKGTTDLDIGKPVLQDMNL